jgi:hypothetical protein
MSYQNYQNGLYGGPASDTSSYRMGYDLRMIREASETAKAFRDNPFIRPPESIPQPNAPHFHDNAPRSSSEPGRVSLPAYPFDGWFDHPMRAFITLTVALAVSFTMIWPAFDAIGVPRFAAWLAWLTGHSGQSGQTIEGFVRFGVLGYASYILSAWTKAHWITLATGILLLWGAQGFIY